ncbi:type II toxin-antitoxin system HicA family toxin [Lachnospiraceae bacterium 46-61]
MRDKDLLKLLQKNGWVVKRIKGSHHVMQKDDKIQIIAVHNKDVPTGLLNKILKETGLK